MCAWCVHTHTHVKSHLPHCIMDLKRKSQAGPMPWTIKTRWSTFSGSPAHRDIVSERVSTVGNIPLIRTAQPYHQVFLLRCCPLLSWLFEAGSALRGMTPTHPAILEADTALSAERGTRKHKRRSWVEGNSLPDLGQSTCSFLVYLMKSHFTIRLYFGIV